VFPLPFITFAFVALVASLLDSAGFVALVTAVLSGGLVASFTAFRKAGPEVESISVATLKGVIEELRAELTRLASENAHLRESVQHLEAVSRENDALRARIARLEVLAESASNG
jgi:hypothetical protein